MRVSLKNSFTNRKAPSIETKNSFFGKRLNKHVSIADHMVMGKTLPWFGMPPEGGGVLGCVINQKTLV
jgi:hypothetical protein